MVHNGNFIGGATLIGTRPDQPQATVNEAESTRKTELVLQMSVLNNFDLKQLRDLQASLLQEQIEVNKYFELANETIPVLKKSFIEMELIQKLNSTIGEPSPDGNEKLTKKYERSLFEFEMKKSRKTNIADVLHAIEKVLPLKMLNSSIADVTATFKDIEAQYQANKKRLLRGDYGTLKTILNRLFTEITNVNNLEFQISKTDQEGLHPSQNLIYVLNHKLQSGGIHVRFLHEEKLLTIQDFLNGELEKFMLQTVDELFEMGNTYISMEG